MKKASITLLSFIFYTFTNLFAVSVEEHFDLDYAGTNNPKQKLDLVVPKVKSSTPLPLIAFIHGGGWRKGDKRPSIRRLLKFAESGKYAVASIGYRLSDEAKWPNQIHDCKAAIRFIKANASKYNIDPDKIGIWGSSAGGHLVAMLGTSSEDTVMEGSIGKYTNFSSDVHCVVDFYGPTNFLLMDEHSDRPMGRGGHNSPTSPESLLIGGAIQENKDKVQTANPITYVDSKDSTFLIVHGSKDPLVPLHQSQILHKALKDAKVDSTMITVVGGGHGQGFGTDVQEKVDLFFEHHLQGKPSKWADTTLPASERKRRR